MCVVSLQKQDRNLFFVLGEQQLNPSQVLLQHRDLLVRLQNHLQPQLQEKYSFTGQANIPARLQGHRALI